MMKRSGLQYLGQLLLDNSHYALLGAITLAMLPYASWLAGSVVALITLRKGAKEGAILLCGAILAHSLILLISLPYHLALINTLLIFMPCYIAAYVLRYTASWRAVFGMFFIQIFLLMVLLQTQMPDFIKNQFLYFKAILANLEGYESILTLLNNSQQQTVLANYFVGLQSIGVVFHAVSALIFARFIQSQLFYPEGFKQEILSFRGEKIGLVLLVIMFWLSAQNYVLAINLLPGLLFYFLLAGLSVCGYLMAKKKPFVTLLLLFVPVLLLPVMLIAYILFGVLDSLFNFRFYLQKKANKKI